MKPVAFSMPVIIVEDINTSRRFYQDLFGLEVEHDFGENVVFKNAFSLWERRRAGEIIFDGKETAFKGSAVKPLELYFETTDLDTVWSLMRQKRPAVIHGPREEPWGQRTVRLFDPDGFIVEIAEPMDCVVRRLHEKGVPESDIAAQTQLPRSVVKTTLRSREKK